MDSSKQTALSSAISWMSAAMATKWHRPADCSTHEPNPTETRSHWLLTCASQARRVCSLIPSEDTAGCQGPPHTGGRWRGTTNLGHWGSGRQELPVCSQSADSSSASAVHEEVASHGSCRTASNATLTSQRWSFSAPLPSSGQLSTSPPSTLPEALCRSYRSSSAWRDNWFQPAIRLSCEKRCKGL